MHVVLDGIIADHPGRSRGGFRCAIIWRAKPARTTGTWHAPPFRRPLVAGRGSTAEVQLRKSTPPAVGPIAPWVWPAKLATPPPRHRSEPRRRSAVIHPTSDTP